MIIAFCTFSCVFTVFIYLEHGLAYILHTLPISIQIKILFKNYR